MTVLEAVKHSRSGVFLCKKAIPVAQAALIDPEAVLWAHTGNVRLNTAPDSAETILRTGVTVFTTHRVLFASRITSNWLTRSIVLADITDVRTATEGSFMYLHIHSPENHLAIQGTSKSISKLNTALKSAIAQAKTIDPDTLTDFRSALAAQPNTPEEKSLQEAPFDTVLAAVKRSRSGVFLCKKAIPLAQSALIDTEAVLWAYTCNVRLSTAPDSAETVTKTGVAVITSHRILFASHITSNWLTRSIVLADITDVRTATEGSFMYLHIHSPENHLAIQGTSKSISKLNTALKSAIAQAKTIDPDALAGFRSALAAQPKSSEEKSLQEAPFDTVLAAVKRSRSGVFLCKKAIPLAQSALIDTESVLWAYTCNVRLSTAPDSAETVLKTGVAVITSHRILFASHITSNWLTRSIVLADITDVRTATEDSFMYLHIHSPENHLAIQSTSKSISELNTALESAIAQAKTIDPDTLTDFRSVLSAQPNTPEEKSLQEAPFDTVLAAVKRSSSGVFMYKKTIALAQDFLIDPEAVLWAYICNVRLSTAPDSAETVMKAGVTVITTHRVLFASGSVSNWLTRSIVLADITDVRTATEDSLMCLHIHSPENHLAIRGTSKSIRELNTALESAIAQAKTIDPEALADFRSALTAQPNTPEEKIDPEPYFQKHYPDIARAAREMHRDTGVVSSKCQKIVDAYFAANIHRAPKRKHVFPRLPPLSPEQQAALDKRIEELDQQGIAYCPHCASVSISVQKRGFFGSAGSSYYYLSSGFRLLYRAIRAHEHVCFCMKCGHTWKP